MSNDYDTIIITCKEFDAVSGREFREDIEIPYNSLDEHTHKAEYLLHLVKQMRERIQEAKKRYQAPENLKR